MEHRGPLLFPITASHSNETYLRGGKSIDYYFFMVLRLPTASSTNTGLLTGHTPMLPEWAYGLFQSKDRYVSLDEILRYRHRYRSEHIPLDVMVQTGFGGRPKAIRFSTPTITDVAADLEALHKQNVHAMISVWGLLDPNSRNLSRSSTRRNELVPGAHVYDATNPDARDIYWQHLPVNCSRRVGMPSGSTAPSPKSIGRTWATPS